MSGNECDLRLRVYLSSATNPFSDKELVELLGSALQNNQRNNITGMLLYADGCILQAFEGPSEKVETLFNKISSDSRHRGLISLINRSASSRVFPNWSMDFRRAELQQFDSVSGLSDYLRSGSFSGEVKESEVLRLFEQFRRSNVRNAA